MDIWDVILILFVYLSTEAMKRDIESNERHLDLYRIFPCSIELSIYYIRTIETTLVK